MTNRTVTARSATYAGTIAGITFASGTATADDATAAGKALIEFAKRAGWSVSGGVASAVTETVAQGKPVSKWTVAECKAYLDAANVQYPSATVVAELRKAVLDAFETKAQGGSAANLSAGHIMGTMPVEGAPNVPGDNDEVADKWVTPQVGNSTVDVAPAVTVEPTNKSVTAPAAATFGPVTVTGSPTPSLQWERAEAATPTEFVAIDGATATSYTTDATVVADDNGAKYRVIADNTDGTATSAVVTLTVTA